MAAKYFDDAIGEKNSIKVEKWQLFKTMLASPIVFGVAYSTIAKAGNETPTILLCVFAFQNGFFWKSIRPRSRRRPISATQHHPTTLLIGISWHCNEP